MPNPVVHFEIGGRDKERSKAFYSKLFDWKFETRHGGEMVDPGKIEGIPSIGGHLNALGHEPHNYITIYVQVEDVQAMIDKTIALGGKQLVPPVDIGFAHFAWIGDPDGNIVGLYKPKT